MGFPEHVDAISNSTEVQENDDDDDDKDDDDDDDVHFYSA